MAKRYFFPAEFEDDLKGTGLPEHTIHETLTHAWQYSRSTIPHYTNRKRYIALTRLCEIAVVAEFQGQLVQVVSSGTALGFDIDELIHTLFGGRDSEEKMRQEFYSSILFSSEKASGRRGSQLLRRYIAAIARSPANWFRIRDCDGLGRFYIEAAAACSDLDSTGISDDEYDILGELSFGLYDAVAFQKHRAEAEICSTFAYVDPAARTQIFHAYRDVLWELELQGSEDPALQQAFNFVRPVGGPVHMMMDRYRFVEDDLQIGLPYTKWHADQARENAKLWHRMDSEGDLRAEQERYEQVLRERERLLFPGFADMLIAADRDRCPRCAFRDSYGADAPGAFGGVKLCAECQASWTGYALSIHQRAALKIPLLKSKPRLAG